MDKLNQTILRSLLQRPLVVEVQDSIDSTNNELKRRYGAGETGDRLLVAEMQTGGRGRLGRSFYSPAGSGLYFSLGLTGITDFADAVLLTTVASTAVVEAIETLTPHRPAIKWVNDILENGRKLGGILTEAVTAPDGTLSAVIIGIGLNVAPSAFPPELADIAGWLDLSPVTREQLTAAIVNRIYGHIETLPQRGYLPSYRVHSLVLGKTVRVLTDPPFTATAVAIDDNGGLVIEHNATRQTLSTGEISIRIE